MCRITSNAALYGIENTNRGCQLDAADTASIRSASIDRRLGPGRRAGGGRATPADQRGCAIGGPIALINRVDEFRVGFSTGKTDVFDPGEPLDVPVNPGGFARLSKRPCRRRRRRRGRRRPIRRVRRVLRPRAAVTGLAHCRATRCRRRARCSSTDCGCRSSPTASACSAC